MEFAGKSILSSLQQCARSPWLLGILDQIIFGATGFLTGIVIAQTCSQAQFGLFTLGVTMTLIVLDVQSGLISTPQSLRWPLKDAVQRQSFGASTFIHLLLLAAAGSALMTLFAVFARFADATLAEMAAVLPAIAAVLVFTLLREYLRRLYFMQKKLPQVIVLDGTVAVVQLVLLVCLASNGTANATNAHLVVGIAAAIVSVPLACLCVGRFTFSYREALSDFKDNFQIGKWSVLSNLLWTTGTYCYPWLLAISRGPEDTAVWAACVGVISVVHIALAGVLNVLTPDLAGVLARTGKSAVRPYLRKTCQRFALVTAALALGPVALGEMLIVAIYGPMYAGTGAIIAILALNAILVSVTSVVSRALMVLGRANADFLVNLFVCVFSIGFGWLAVTHYGLPGAAMSLLLANSLGALLRTLSLVRMTRPDPMIGPH